MSKKILGKRSTSTIHKPNKKQKLVSSGSSQTKSKGKERAADRAYIPLPVLQDEDDPERLSNEDLAFFEENGVNVGGFLTKLDEKAIGRSKKEQDRIHRLSKPKQETRNRDTEFPTLDSSSEDDGSWSSGIEDDEYLSDANSIAESSSSSTSQKKPKQTQTRSEDEEMPYEALPRKQHTTLAEQENKGIARLPIKLQDGKIYKSGERVIPQWQDESDVEPESDIEEDEEEIAVIEDVSTGARFGRPAVIDVISAKSRKARVQASKEQIASLCQDIVAEPENSLGLLRRLHTFCQAEISSKSHPEPVANDIIVRKLAFLSQMAVFKDIVPGYRIRPLTEKEKGEKVSQIVQRTRDFEQGLVSVYQSYLRTLEVELRAKSELADTALRCFCQLLTDLTHFNFRVNLMTAVITQLSKKSWGTSSELCLKTLSTVLRSDQTGLPSLEIVRLLNRMIKERHYRVHPNVLFCLLDLRLKTELGGIRASQSKADKEKSTDQLSKGRAAIKRAKGKTTNQPHLSKKARKNLKETKAIEEEMREADAEVDREERATTHTETLKLLFVLYFRILKNPYPTPLLPAALQGISKFAHLVNIDFFKDLLQVLRDHITRDPSSEKSVEGDEQPNDERAVDVQTMHTRLHCVVTAFELLSGQGEALNLDLTDFINHLYALITPMSLSFGVEDPVAGIRTKGRTDTKSQSYTPVDMLFRALNLVFTSRSATFARSPPWRAAAFAKRLVLVSLQLPPSTSARIISFVHTLVAQEPMLEALLSTEDRMANGIYRVDVDDPQLCNAFATNLWELHLLAKHIDKDVKAAALALLDFSRD